MDYVIETRFQGPGFVAVPNAVAQMENLGADALGVLVWLASLPQGFTVRRQTLLERFKFGKDKWQRIARELTECGALQVTTQRGAGGLFSRSYLVRWPEPVAQAPEPVETPEPENPVPVAPEPENPPKNGGKPAKKVRETRLSIQKKKQTKGAMAAKPAPRQPRRLPPEGVGAVGSAQEVGAEGLNSFQRSCLREGKSLLVNGCIVRPGSPEFSTLAQAAGVA